MPDRLDLKLIRGLSPREKVSRLIVLAMTLWIITLATVVFIQALDWVGKPFPGFLLNQRMVNPGVGQYHWTGTQAGVNSQDRVLEVNGQPVNNFPDLLAVVASVPVGDSLTYTMEREGRTFSLTLPSMRFTVGDLIVLFGIDYLIGITYFVLGLIVFVLKPDSRVSWVYLVASFFLSSNHITGFDVAAVHAGFLPLFFFGSGILPALGIHLSMLFPEPSRLVQRFPGLQVVPYLLSASLLIPLFVFFPGPIFISAYSGVFIYFVISALCLIIAPLVTFFRKVSILAQQRAKVVLWGAMLAFPIPALGQLGMFLRFTIDGQPIHSNFTGFPVLIFPLAISYAIARHNLFDVDVYIKRAVGYGLMTVIVALGYFSIQTVLRTFVLDPIFGKGAEQVYPIVFAVLVVFLFNPAFKAVQDFVDSLFFRAKFDYKGTIAAVSNALTTMLDQKAIVQQLIHTVRHNMFVDTAGLVLVNAPNGRLSMFVGSDHPGEGNGRIRESEFSSDDPLLALLSREKKLITKYDVAEGPQYESVRDSCGQRFNELGASLAVPLIHQNEVKGLLALGYKKSGHFYNREDIALLETLANQGAVAIENSRLAEQMKRDEGVRANLARYLSPQIVDRIMHNDVQVNLGGNRKIVSIVFSDIRNFTTISESWPPDQLVSILNEYFTEMAQIIFEHQGSLDKYIGDAIVAVFGSLIPLDNSPHQAVTAATSMIRRMPDLNAEWKRKYNFSMEIGIGVTTGEVFLGNIGSPERMEFTVIGDTVNVASRFSGLAKAGQILVTRETFSQLGDSIPCHALPPTEVKGKSGKLEVFEVLVDQVHSA